MKSREEIWETLHRKIDTDKTPGRSMPHHRREWWLVAATVAVLLGVTVFLRFYSHVLHTVSGEIATMKLPDGSTVTLNAQTKLTYYPLWWKISPKLTLYGEAFFQGHHSRRFTVKSERGIVTVLGTSFDIYARHDNYRVVCFTGKVRVTSPTKNRIVLTRGEKAIVTPIGDITFSKNIIPTNYNAWTNQQFVFTAEPLPSVLDELARHYNVTIDLKKNIQTLYTGNFPGKIPIEQALHIVCKPFGLTFVEKDNRHFVIQ